MSDVRESNKNKKPLDPTVVAALITVIGGIITTLIVTFVNRPPGTTYACASNHCCIYCNSPAYGCPNRHRTAR